MGSTYLIVWYRQVREAGFQNLQGLLAELCSEQYDADCELLRARNACYVAESRPAGLGRQLDAAKAAV